MGHEAKWYLKDRIIQTRNYGVVTLDELKEADEIVTAMLESGRSPIYIISDNSAIEHLPFSFTAVRLALKGLRHPALGWVIHVGSPSGIPRMLARLVAKAARIHFRQMDTFEQALEFLNQQDPTLDIDKSSGHTNDDDNIQV